MRSAPRIVAVSPLDARHLPPVYRENASAQEVGEDEVQGCISAHERPRGSSHAKAAGGGSPMKRDVVVFAGLMVRQPAFWVGTALLVASLFMK
jgi:hypothetical protein